MSTTAHSTNVITLASRHGRRAAASYTAATIGGERFAGRHPHAQAAIERQRLRAGKAAHRVHRLTLTSQPPTPPANAA